MDMDNPADNTPAGGTPEDNTPTGGTPAGYARMDDGTVGDTTVDDAIAIAEHEWRAMGVVHRDLATLSEDLRLELYAARADGIGVRQLVGDDIRAFARTLATEAQVHRVPYETGRILRTALVGALPGVLYGWAMLWWVPYTGESPIVLLLTRYVVAAALIVGGALFMVRRHLGDLPAVGRTIAAMAVLVPVAILLVTPLTIGFAATTGYSTALPVLIVEVGLVVGALAGAITLARRWALRPALTASGRPNPA